VDTADPLLLDRNRVDRRDLEWTFGARPADETRHRERCGTGSGTGENLTAFEEIGMAGHGRSCHG
jgi:hypothetical protein